MKHKYGTRGDLISCPYKEELQKYKQFAESVKEYTNKIDCDSKECMGCGYDIIRNTLKQLIEGLK